MTKGRGRRRLAALLAVGVVSWAGSCLPAAAQDERPIQKGREGPVTRTRQTYYFFVTNSPKPDRVADFDRWYDRQHAQDVLINPDFVGSRRFVISDRQLRPGTAPPARNMIAFEIDTRDIARAFGYVADNLRSGKTAPTDTVMAGTSGNFTYRAVTPRRPGAAAKSPPADANGRYLQIEFDTVPAGQEKAYARWHDRIHAPRVAALPQTRSWQRFELSPVQFTGKIVPLAARSMTMYELDVASPASFDDLQRRVAAIDAGETRSPVTTRSALTYRAAGVTLLGRDVKRERALR